MNGKAISKRCPHGIPWKIKKKSFEGSEDY
jgi:hypothetical protein